MYVCMVVVVVLREFVRVLLLKAMLENWHAMKSKGREGNWVPAKHNACLLALLACLLESLLTLKFS